MVQNLIEVLLCISSVNLIIGQSTVRDYIYGNYKWSIWVDFNYLFQKKTKKKSTLFSYRCDYMRFCRRFLSLGSWSFRRGIRILFFTRYFWRFARNWHCRAGRISIRHDGEFIFKKIDLCQFNYWWAHNMFSRSFLAIFTKVFVAF